MVLEKLFSGSRYHFQPRAEQAASQTRTMKIFHRPRLLAILAQSLMPTMITTETQKKTSSSQSHPIDDGNNPSTSIITMCRSTNNEKSEAAGGSAATANGGTRQRAETESSNPLIRVLRCLNAILHMMAVCITAYFVILYFAPMWLRTLLLAYQFAYSPLAGYDSTIASFIPKNWKKFMRSEFTIRWTAKYFRMLLIKTAELDPSQSYLFAYHPHGVISMGYATGLCTNGCAFEDVFPGIDRSGTTLKATFMVPFYREWLQMIGFIVASKRNIIERLKSGKSIMLVPGGASEALHAHPGCFDLYLSNRKGFVKMAMETGCCVVPCLGFGENSIFGTAMMAQSKDPLDSESTHSVVDPLRKSIHAAQKSLQKKMTFSLPILTNFVPRRQGVTIVVGKPIRFEDTNGSDRAAVDKNHKLYLDSLRKLYDEHKATYGEEGVELRVL